MLALSADQISEDLLLAPIDPDIYLLPGLVPAEAYTLIAGALSSYKSTLLIYLCLWRATGYDLLGLDPTEAGCDIGPVLLLAYEDSKRRIVNRVRRIVQHAHAELGKAFGAKSAAEFIRRVTRHLRVVPLTGKVGATIVHRGPNGLIVPNEALIESIRVEGLKLTTWGLMIGIDPLRLAIVGSQNDDDGADIAVHTLNRISMQQPNTGLVVASHTTKSEAKDTSAAGYASAAYATSGSALYSQHARSNFLLTRMKPKDAENLLDIDLSPQEWDTQPVARLTHGRLSHGPESSDRYLLMKSGVLVPVSIRRARDAQQQIDDAAAVIIPAIDRMKAKGTKISASSLLLEPDVRRLQSSEADVRKLINLVDENGFIEFTGKTKNKDGFVTETGRRRFGTNQNESSDRHG